MHHEFQTDDFAQSFIGVWKRVTSEPRSFFQEMPVSGGLTNPLIFAVVCLAISGLGFLIIGPRVRALSFVVEGVIRSFVYAALFVLIARQVFGGTGDYEATYRVVAYAMAPFALYWIPLVGKLAALYSMVLVMVGLERVQGFDAVKSVLTLLLSAIAILAISWALGMPHAWMPSPMTRGC